MKLVTVTQVLNGKTKNLLVNPQQVVTVDSDVHDSKYSWIYLCDRRMIKVEGRYHDVGKLLRCPIF